MWLCPFSFLSILPFSHPSTPLNYALILYSVFCSADFYFSFIFCQSTLKQIIYYFIEVWLIFSSSILIARAQIRWLEFGSLSLIMRVRSHGDRLGSEIDLGPFASIIAHGQMCPRSNKIQNNYEGWKITACMCSWGKLGTRRYKKTKNPTTTSEKPRAKAEYCACPLHPTQPKGWTNHLSHPTPGHSPTLIRV